MLLQFDGIDDYVSTPFVLNPADGAFSVFAWIKGGAPGQVIISQTDFGGIGQVWICTDSSEGNLMTELRHIAGRVVQPPLRSQAVITDGDWHRVGFVWDGSNRILYVDGVEVAKDTQGQLGDSAGGLYIGAGSTLDAASFFSGLIDLSSIELSLPVDVGSVRYAHLANINFTYETIIIHDGSQYTRAQSQILKSLLPQ